MFINSMGFTVLGKGTWPYPVWYEPHGSDWKRRICRYESFLANALSERQIPAMISLHSLNRCTKTGMLEYLVVGSGEGRPADRPNCSPPLIAHHGSFGYDD